MSTDMVIERSKKSIKNRIIILLAIVLTAIIVASGFLWNHYLNKNNLLAKYESLRGQDVYILGTWHMTHFNKWLNYSMADVLSVVEQVQPDVVFIEAREEYFLEYGVMDGPVDMAVVYGYCLENGVPTEMIDWFVVDNDFQGNSTNDKRDDMIFNNIVSKLNTYNPDIKVLIVCGAAHYHEQTKRFRSNGFEKQAIKDIASYFKNQSNPFQYPSPVQDIWEQRSYFYAYTYPEIISQDETINDEIKSQFTGGNAEAFYRQQLHYNELFLNNDLYD